MCDVVCSFSGVLIGAALGAALGALFGWLLVMKENERIDFRRFNEQQLERLTHSAGDFLRQAATADAASIEFVVRQAKVIGSLHMGRDPKESGFTIEEQQAVGKFVLDLQAAMRAINAAAGVEEKLIEWDKATAMLDRHVAVLSASIYEQSAPGIRALFRSY